MYLNKTESHNEWKKKNQLNFARFLKPTIKHNKSSGLLPPPSHIIFFIPFLNALLSKRRNVAKQKEEYSERDGELVGITNVI